MNKIEIHNKDCFEFLEQIEKNSIKLILTDPPYDIECLRGGGIANAYLNKSQQKISDISSGYDIEKFSFIVKKIQSNINCYFFCNKRQIPEYIRCYVHNLKCRFDIICWHKTNPQATYSNKWLPDTEYVLHFYKGKGTTKPQCYKDGFTWYISPNTRQLNLKYGHPTIKPLELVRRIIRNSSCVDDYVLDPFMGSGTTALGCLSEGRNFIGIEINDKYCDIAKKRIEEYINGNTTE